jgi:ribosomal peptide maturation radical SAM protein 1
MAEAQVEKPMRCTPADNHLVTEVTNLCAPTMLQVGQVTPTGSPTHTGRIVLVSMPFGPLFTPSIALGLLSSELRNAGFETETLYFTIRFAKQIGVTLYELISSGAPETSLLLGDWLFRDALFGTAAAQDNLAYMGILEDAVRTRSQSVPADSRWRTSADLQADLIRIRGAIDEFLNECAQTILRHNPMLTGFTTVFQQNVASLALSKRLKELSPEMKIVFGGANCESIMGTQLLESFPAIDYVVSGEGEAALVCLARAISSLAAARPGQKAPHAPGREPFTGLTAVEMDALNYPEYDSYFEQVKELPEVERRARLLFESSRGCWWGEKSHCTFCGLNGMSMAFRSKSANRSLAELTWMTSKYPGHAVSVVDNILDFKYFDTFIPMLQRAPMEVELFYEVKANLRKSQLRQLRSANIRRIQPGIESLHDGVLSIMKKGVSAIQNIQLLKWSLELGIEPLWNLIWGFPGEEPEWYSEMAALVPQLRHLPPPDSVSEIRLDRFSPLFNDARLGALCQKPFPAYDCVYAELTPEERFRLAYHFTFEYGDARDVEGYTNGFRREVLRWQASFGQSAFFSISMGDQLLLCDMRDAANVSLTVLDATDTHLYQLCDFARTAEGAHLALGDPAITCEECEERLQTLAAGGAMLEIQGKYLSLAIEMNENVPNVSALERFQSFLQSNNMSMDESISRVHVKSLRDFHTRGDGHLAVKDSEYAR